MSADNRDLEIRESDIPETVLREPLLDAQRWVYDAIEGRGYYRGYSYNQLLSRQAAKLVEEIAEFAAETWQPWPLRLAVRFTGWLARRYFDKRSAWDGADRYLSVRPMSIDLKRMLELADVQVVIFSAAEIMRHADHSTYSVGAVAIKKARADIKRGVRAAGETK